MVQTATNPQTGETLILEGKDWKPAQTATNPKTGEKMVLAEGKWQPIPGKAPSKVEDFVKGLRGSSEELGAFGGELAVGLSEAARTATGGTGLMTPEMTKQVAGWTEEQRAAAERDKPAGLAGQIGAIPATAVEYATGIAPAKAGAERYMELSKQGAAAPQAALAGVYSFATAAAATAIPFGKGLVKGAASGAAANIGALVADKEFTKLALAGNYPEIEKRYGISKDDLISSGLLGAVFGGLIGHVTGKVPEGTPKGSTKAAGDAFGELVKENPEQIREAASNVHDPKARTALLKKIDEIVPSAKDVKKIFSKKEMRQAPVEMDEIQLQDIFRKAKERPAEPTAPTVSGIEVGEATMADFEAAQQRAAADLRNTVRASVIANNASGQTPASLEAMNAIAQDRAMGRHTVAVKPSGEVIPLTGIESRDPTPAKGQVILKKGIGADPNEWVVLDHDPSMTPQQVEAAKQKAKGWQPPADPTVYMHAGLPVTREQVKKAFDIGHGLLKKVPVYNTIEREMQQSAEHFIRSIVPEALGKEAKTGAAVIAKNISKQMQQDSAHYYQSEPRRRFWESRLPEQAQFIYGFEKGEKFSDPILQKAAEGYRRWNDEIYKQDQRNGIAYEARDNYLFHTFQDSEGVSRFFESRYGGKWKDPKFTKERGFELYQEAVAAGYTPKYTNPEDIMQARQHASDVAEMQVNSLKEMADAGIARPVAKGETKGVGEVEWRAPNGQRYWVHENAAQVLHNAFNTKSLWNAQGIGGTAFRGAMALKNALVPIKLAFSLFHPLHVQTIDNATAMVRATKELLGGTMSPEQWMKSMGSAAAYRGIISNPKFGGRLLNVWKGKIPEEALTAADRQSLAYITEGGMIPEMSAQYKIGAIDRFRKALDQHSTSAFFHFPFAAVEWLQKPMFEKWIPSLKIASYLHDVKTALRTDPTLLENSIKRIEAFRRIAKSVDNRYGEMAYNTLFWNRTVKDIGVASTLSMGWTLGFLREYGGAVGDVAKAMSEGKPVSEQAARGVYDRAMFVGFYTAQSLLYGGLLTWAMTGKAPSQLLDYIYPKNGEHNQDGSDARVNTMFYAREFASVYKHMQTEGPVSGLSQFFINKASPVMGLAYDWARNVDYMGHEISDPNAPEYKQLEQKLAYTLKQFEPISISSVKRSSNDSIKDYGMAIAGFGPAPKYATESPAEAMIKRSYKYYHGTSVTPYEKAEQSDDRRLLRKYYDAGDAEKYGQQLLKMREKYNLTSADIHRMRAGIKTDPTLNMFRTLPPEQQKNILKKMSPEDRMKYIRFANKAVKLEFYREGIE